MDAMYWRRVSGCSHQFAHRDTPLLLAPLTIACVDNEQEEPLGQGADSETHQLNIAGDILVNLIPSLGECFWITLFAGLRQV